MASPSDTDLFNMLRKGYSIWSPPFHPASGGIRVLYGLMGWLLAKGEIAFVNAKFDDPSSCIGIYPEITHGNPMEAGTIVRYILNKPGVMASYGVAGPTEFDKTDKVYVFSKIYDTFGVDENHILFLPIINLNLFKDKKKKRTKSAFYIGKGFNAGQHPKDAIEITRDILADQASLAELFNVCQVMYTYENPTALNEIARLCGCPVRFYQEGCMTNFTKQELEEKYEPGMYGINFTDEMDKFDPKRFRDHYLNLRTIFEVKLDKFIEETQG